MLRVGMTNPPYMLQHLDAIAACLNHPRCYAFLHVPVQSGSDAVLGRMRREYTRAEFCTVADALLSRVPHLTLATDLICGFPGETEADHDATLTLVQKYKVRRKPARRARTLMARARCASGCASGGNPSTVFSYDFVKALAR